MSGDLHGDQIAVNRAGGSVGGNRKLSAELLLVDRDQPATAVGEAAEYAKQQMLGAIHELDDSARCFMLAVALDANECAIADTSRFARSRAPRRDNMNDGRRAVGLLVPFGWTSQEFAIGVASGDVGHDDGRQCAGVMQALAAA